MENQVIIDEFIAEIEQLGLTPVIDGEFLLFEYDQDKELQHKFNRLRDAYTGVWKGIAIETNHSRNPDIARYKIPLSFITKEDLTDEQFDAAVSRVSKRLNGDSDFL